MTFEYCERCHSPDGVICVTCGKRRDKKQHRYGPRDHAKCKRRPHGLGNCAGHDTPVCRCDYCGLKCPMKRGTEFGGFMNFDYPDGWGLENGTRHACLSCRKQLLVMSDAVGGLDFSVIGDLAIQNLLDAIERLDVSMLGHVQVANLTSSCRRLLARMTRADSAEKTP